MNQIKKAVLLSGIFPYLVGWAISFVCYLLMECRFSALQERGITKEKFYSSDALSSSIIDYLFGGFFLSFVLMAAPWFVAVYLMKKMVGPILQAKIVYFVSFSALGAILSLIINGYFLSASVSIFADTYTPYWTKFFENFKLNAALYTWIGLLFGASYVCVLLLFAKSSSRD